MAYLEKLHRSLSLQELRLEREEAEERRKAALRKRRQDILETQMERYLGASF